MHRFIPSVAQRFDNPEPLLLDRTINRTMLIVIDEVQRIRNIGLILKTIYDTLSDTQAIANQRQALTPGR